MAVGASCATDIRSRLRFATAICGCDGFECVRRPRDKLTSRIPSMTRMIVQSLQRAAAVLIVSLWVAICAVAPEFIWQGLRIAYAHPGWSDLLSALLIGLILAFFVEPATERIRDLLHSTKASVGAEEGRSRSVFFTAILSLTFALTSVGLHHAMSAFLIGHGESARGRWHRRGYQAGI
jgi:hypothetical protein